MRSRLKRRHVVWALATLAALLAGGWLLPCCPWQAHYAGRPTRYWARRMAELPELWETPPQLKGSDALIFRAFALVGMNWSPGPSATQMYGKTEAVAVLVELLDDPDPHVQREAARFLAELEPRPKDAIPALLKAWQRCKADYHGWLYGGGLEFGNAVDAANWVHDAIWEIDPESAERAGVPREALPPNEQPDD